MQRKPRTEIPARTAALVLFRADRTCCVCRTPRRPVQIHHLDDDPTNHSPSNLAVLCIDCHHDTQIKGGFDRKLSADQVVLYRNDWHDLVAQSRARSDVAAEATRLKAEGDLAAAMTIAEIYRESEAWESLAVHYHHVGATELRDKYIELALAQDQSDSRVVYLRALQGKSELIPAEVAERVIARQTDNNDWSQRARTFVALNKPIDAAQDYARTVVRSIDEGRIFSAAYYLKEAGAEGLVEALFVEALERSRQADDLWWQVRALQELGWSGELRQLVLDHAPKIDEMDETDLGVALPLKRLLADVRGDKATSSALKISSARTISQLVKRRRRQS